MAEPTAALAAEVRRGYQLRVGDLSQIAVSVALAPQHSVLAMLRQASCDPAAGRFGFVRQRLRPRSRFAFGTFAAPGPTSLPDCCLPIAPAADVTVAEQVGRLRDLPGQVLLDELRGPVGEHLPTAWAAAADQPVRWLRSWAEACLDGWTEISSPRRSAARRPPRPTIFSIWSRPGWPPASGAAPACGSAEPGAAPSWLTCCPPDPQRSCHEPVPL